MQWRAKSAPKRSCFSKNAEVSNRMIVGIRVREFTCMDALFWIRQHRYRLIGMKLCDSDKKG